jgi:glycogen(starch) synthase
MANGRPTYTPGSMPASRPAPPLRVLSVGNVYPPHLLGGYEVIWRGVTRRLQAAGHTARVLVTGYRRPEVAAGTPDDPDVHRELNWYWREHAWPKLSLRETVALERANASVFERHLGQLRPEVVAWWAVGGLSLGLIERTRRAGIPSLFFVLDPWPAYGPQRDRWTRTWARLGPLAAPAGALAERVTGLPARPRLARTGRWLFCSDAMRRTLLDAGFSPEDGAILAPGVESSFLAAPPEPVARAWGWRLLYVGRVVEQKGVTTAVEALAQLPAQTTLRIVGEGDPGYRSELEALAARLGVADRVRFEPPRPHEEVVGVYRDADLVVFPVLWSEPWGLVPLEAMALDRLVVATGRGGSAEFLRDGENCLLFPGGDAAALAAAVVRLGTDQALRERLRVDGRATAAAHSEEAFNRRAVEELARVAGRPLD